LLAAAFVWWWLQKSKWGYRARAFADNPELLPYAKGRNLLLQSMAISSVILGVAVFCDIYLRMGRYTATLYDEKGFFGVAVGLLVFKEPRLMPATALCVSVIEILYLMVSTKLGLPAYWFPIIFGALVLLAVLGAPPGDQKKSLPEKQPNHG
jgi:ABC-type uncharacterized transport system permease subunit